MSRLDLAEAIGNELNLIHPIRFPATEWDLDRTGEDRERGWSDLGFGTTPTPDHLPIVWRYSPERLIEATTAMPIDELIAYGRALRRLLLTEVFVLIDANITTPDGQRYVVPADLREQSLQRMNDKFPDNTFRATLQL